MSIENTMVAVAQAVSQATCLRNTASEATDTVFTLLRHDGSSLLSNTACEAIEQAFTPQDNLANSALHQPSLLLFLTLQYGLDAAASKPTNCTQAMMVAIPPCEDSPVHGSTSSTQIDSVHLCANTAVRVATY